jgi:hypothetical protein
MKGYYFKAFASIILKHWDMVGMSRDHVNGYDTQQLKLTQRHCQTLVQVLFLIVLITTVRFMGCNQSAVCKHRFLCGLIGTILRFIYFITVVKMDAEFIIVCFLITVIINLINFVLLFWREGKSLRK